MRRKKRSIFPNRKWAREGRDATDFLFSMLFTILEWFWRIMLFLCHLAFLFYGQWKNSWRGRKAFFGRVNPAAKKSLGAGKEKTVSANMQDAVLALKSLGVSGSYAQRAIESAAAEVGSNAPVELLIRTGLKHRK